MNGVEWYKNAGRHLQTAIEVYSTASRSIDPYPGDGAWIEEDAGVLTSLVVGDKDVSDLNNQTPLLWAAEKGYEGIVKLLLDKGAAIEVKSSTGQTPLLWAAVKGHQGIVKLLVDQSAQDGSFLNNALQAASAGGHDKVVQMLLDKGADANAQGGRYSNALQAASAKGYNKVVQMLLDKGADVNAQGGNYGNAL